MQHAVGSHRDVHELLTILDRYSYDDAAIESQYEIYDALGPKGTLFIFDPGNGFHRGLARAGTTRKMLHCNVTAGHYLTTSPRLDRYDACEGLKSSPRHVRRMFARVAI